MVSSHGCGKGSWTPCIGKALHSAAYSYTTKHSLSSVSQFYVLSVVFWLVNRHVIEKQEIGFTKGSKCDVENIVSPSLDSTPAAILQFTSLELDCQCCFKF